MGCHGNIDCWGLYDLLFDRHSSWSYTEPTLIQRQDVESALIYCRFNIEYPMGMLFIDNRMTKQTVWSYWSCLSINEMFMPIRGLVMK